MDYSKFPFQRGAAGAGEGARQARILATNDTPAMRRKNLDGSVSRKVGDRLYVDPAPEQDMDAYLSAGRSAAGQVRSVSSVNARGKFRDRGAVASNGQIAEWNSSALRYYGNGMASANRLTWKEGDGAEVPDFNGFPAQVLTATQYQTRNGTFYKEVYSVQATRTYTGSNRFMTHIGTTAPTLIRQGERKQWIYEAQSGAVCALGQYVFFYVVDLGATQYYGKIKTIEYQLAVGFLAQSLGPLGRFGVGTYMRPEFSQSGLRHPIDVGRCPGLEFHLSEDGGLNWEPINSLPMLQEFADTVLALPVGYFEATTFNIAVNWFSMTVVPLNLTMAVVLMVVPYVTPVSVDRFAVNAKIKMGVIDLVSRTVVETVVLEDSATPAGQSGWAGAEAAAAGYLAGWEGVAIKGGALFLVRPLGAEDYRDNAPRCLFTTDGVNIQWKPFLPWPGWRVGSPKAISGDTIVLPVYEWGRGYVLYQSNDLGESWTLRATLSDTAPPPVKVESRAYLLDFSRVEKLRDGPTPANATPGAPWASDSRFTPPIA